MSNTKERPIIALSPEFKVSYPQISKPSQYQDNAKLMYSVEAIIKPEDLGKFRVKDDSGDTVQAHLEQLALQAAKREWGQNFNAKAACDAKDMKWPVKYGDEIIAKKDPIQQDRLGHYEGMRIFSSKCNAVINGKPNAPVVRYQDDMGMVVNLDPRNPDHTAKIDELFKPGNFACAEINVKAYEVSEIKHVVFYLNKIMFLREGERIGSTSLMDDAFSGVSGGQSDYNPTQGMADEIP
jgi:hypothetical protein